MGLHPRIRTKRSSFTPSTNSQSRSLFITRPFAPPEPEAAEAETDASAQRQTDLPLSQKLINIPLFSPDTVAASVTPSAAIQRRELAELDKKKDAPIQAKLAIGKPDDVYDRLCCMIRRRVRSTFQSSWY